MNTVSMPNPHGHHQEILVVQREHGAKSREDFVAAAAILKVHPDCNQTFGTVGFCWGGGRVNYLATRLSDLSAGVPFYGSAADTADVPKITAPLLIQSAEVDDRINASGPEFEAVLKSAGVRYERFRR